MPFRRSLSLRPIHSEKIETITTNLAENAGTTKEVVIATAIRNPVVDTDVHIGATIKWIYLELNVSAETITNPKSYNWVVQKMPTGQNAITPNQVNPLARRFVFKRGMEMFPKDLGTVFKRIFVVRIPPRYRRMGENDKLVFRYIASSTETVNTCLLTIHKVYD